MAGRMLTTGEITLARSVFDSHLKTHLVKIFNEKWGFFQPADRAMSPNGNIYYPPGNKDYSSDFAAADVHKQATFIHELTHVWQYQNGVNLYLRGPIERDYDYSPLTATTKFSDLGIEEQAQLVRDYFYLTRGHRSPSWPAIDVYKSVIPWIP